MSFRPPGPDRSPTFRPFHAGAGRPATPAAGPAAPRRIASQELFAGDAVEVEIEHQQQIYRLRRTALGKLILTK
jgi:hemin uptake protein HemP